MTTAHAHKDNQSGADHLVDMHQLFVTAPVVPLLIQHSLGARLDMDVQFKI